MKKKRAAKEKGFNLPSFFTKETIVVAGLLLLAFIIRLIYLSHLKANDPTFYQPPEGTDMLTYHNYAKQILNGTFGKEPYYYGPLYFYFLALVYKIFGIDPYIARLIQMLLGVATSFLIYLIARRCFNKTVGLISLVISIFYGMFYIHEGVLLMESLVTFLNTLSIFLLLRIEDKPSYKNIALAGIAIGLSALARANILLFVPFILIWMLIVINNKAPRRAQRIPILNLSTFHFPLLTKYLFLCSVILLTISPCTIRNYLVSGKFVLISTNGPVNLWIGNNPYAEGDFYYPPPSYRDRIANRVKEEGDIAYIKEAIKFFRERPEAFLKLQLRKFFLFWDRYEIENNVNYNYQKRYSSLFRLPIFFSFGLIVPFSLLGILLSLKDWRRRLLFYLIIFSFMISTIIFFITARYRISILPLLIPFSSFSLWFLYKKGEEKRYGVLFFFFIALVLFSLLSFSQEITSRVYPIIHPDGFHIWQPEGMLIRDTTSIRHGEGRVEMRSSGDIIKKELIVKENPTDYKKAVLWFIASIGTKPGVLSIQINNKEVLASFAYSRELLDKYPIELKTNWLKEGVNTIILKPDGTIEMDLTIDNFYSFGRSYILKDGRWERLKNGEFMVWLELVE
ncbi:glycosyltransferase family 39 protein [bacterium]|nr:glycosyltransferase family 39 protein [bacterium]MBU1599148.1 glycosyltransferase family 39 protein [bacterium]